MKIFIGFSEIANFVQSYKKGFENNNHSTFTVVTNRNNFYPLAKYDVVIADYLLKPSTWNRFIVKVANSIIVRFVTYFSFLKALFTCEVFYYNTGGNMLPFAMDYKLIKLFKKKLVIIYLGSEIRHWYAYQKELEELGYAELFATCIETYRQQKYGTYFEKKHRVDIAEKYADLILSQPGFAQLQTRPYLRSTVGLNLKDYKYNLMAREIPIIVHAPSSRGIKGTEFILDAINKLRDEGINFEFKLIENLPNHKLIELLQDVDIVVDELNSDTIGVLSTEGMATGNVVLTSYLADFVKVPLPCPILNTTRNSIYENLKRAIIDIEFRKRTSEQNRKYVEEHNDVSKIAKREIDILFNSSTEKLDFYPTFYSKLAIPEQIKNEI